MVLDVIFSSVRIDGDGATRNLNVVRGRVGGPVAEKPSRPLT